MNANYVNMGQGVQPGTTTSPAPAPGLEDSNLSQEETDLRLALALQQQENAAAYDAHKKTQDAAIAAKKNRTTRSNYSTGLASIRRAQKNTDVSPGGYENDGAYNAPGSDSNDAALAAELQKVEHATAGTAQLMEQIVKEDSEEKKSTTIRSGRSHYHM
mmetsp:Transcript_21232/g.31438  ORF Transcript_21232/g.31438 Transcript_21232/m.31438 type:complete len:159 (-) Transcript_21232:349-825(-)